MASTTPALQFWGLGSGLTSEGSMIDALLLTDNQKVTELQDKQKQITTDKSTWSLLSGKFNDLSSKLSAISSITSTKLASLSSDGFFTVSTSSSAASSAYKIEISQLAKVHTVISNQQATTSDALNLSGSFKINGFQIDVAASDSLSSIVSKINSAVDPSDKTKAITARSYIVDRKLVLENKTAGDGNTIAFDDADGILKSLGIIKSDGTANTLVSPSDAVFTVNNINIRRNTNVVSDVVDGATITLKKETTSPVDLTISDDVDGIVSKISAIVDSINSVLTQTSGLTAKGSSMQGNSIVNSLKDRIIQAIQGEVSNPDSINYAFKLGLSIDKSGNFTLSTDKLKEALKSNFSGVMRFLNNDTGVKTGVVPVLVSGNEYSLNSKGIIGGTEVIYENGVPLTKITDPSKLDSSAKSYTIDTLTGKIKLSSDVAGALTADFKERVTTGTSAGLISRLKGLASEVTSTANGTIKTAQDILDARYKTLTSQIEEQQRYIDTKKQRLTAQYANLEKIMTQYKGIQSYLSTDTSSSSSSSS